MRDPLRAPPDAAVAQTVAFVVAGSLFLAVFGALLLSTTETTSTDDGGMQDSSNRLEAERLAGVLAGTAGVGWSLGADHVTRLGLLHEDGDRLDGDRLDALRGASHDPVADNDRVDYTEALRGLDLPTDGSAGFHVRVAPVGLQNALQTVDLGHVRTAYVGHWLDLGGDVEVGFGLDEAMAAEARAGVEVNLSLLVPSERQILVDLGLGFDDRIHLFDLDVEVDMGPLLPDVDLDALLPASLLEGDVYPDDKQYLNAALPGRIGEYDLLVVGSTLTHDSLSGSTLRDAVRDWVVAGGTLLVFGSESSDFDWLQPLFHVGTATVNAAPATPDVSHPVLHEPHRLDWTAYDHHGLAWDLPESGANAVHAEFQHVIVSEGEDVLTISNEGVFGAGRVFLTMYRPGEVATTLSADEGRNLVHNIIVYQDRAHLYLDYGPTPPDDAAVSAAVRTTQVEDPAIGMVSVRLTVLYWDL